jgi:hypothetical protein
MTEKFQSLDAGASAMALELSESRHNPATVAVDNVFFMFF